MGNNITLKQYFVFNTTERFHAVYAGKRIFNHELIPDRITKDYSLYVITDGEKHMFQGDREQIARRAEFIFHQPYVLEGYKQESNATFYWLHFIPKEYPEIINEKELIQKINDDPDYLANKIVLPEQGALTNLENVVILINLFLYSLKGLRNQINEDYYVTLICSEISKQIITKLLNVEDKTPMSAKRIKEYIDLYFQRVTTVNELADKFEYNSKYISALFEKYYGVSLKKYIDMVKMWHADALLLDTNLTIKEIAYLVGYKDEHLFMRKYKKQREMTPSVYRKSRGSR